MGKNFPIELVLPTLFSGLVFQVYFFHVKFCFHQYVRIILLEICNSLYETNVFPIFKVSTQWSLFNRVDLINRIQFSQISLSKTVVQILIYGIFFVNCLGYYVIMRR